MKYDYHHVSPEHAEIHARCENRARYVAVHKPRRISPIWKLGKSNGRCWELPKVNTPVDQEDGKTVEETVRLLIPNQREALRWQYYWRTKPAGVCRQLGITHEGLYNLVNEARTQLVRKLNRL